MAAMEEMWKKILLPCINVIQSSAAAYSRLQESELAEWVSSKVSLFLMKFTLLDSLESVSLLAYCGGITQEFCS